MEDDTVFDTISKAFAGADIPYLLVGGFAVNAYHYGRATRDIDFMLSTDSLEKADTALKRCGFEKTEHSEMFSRWERKKKFSLTIDILLSNQATLEEMIQQGRDITIGGAVLRIPSLEHLIAMKLHAIKQQPQRRQWKDWVDIIQLIKVNSLDVETERFKDVCLKFGPPEIYKKILESVRHES